MSKRDELYRALDDVMQRHARIDMLFHTAGVLRDGIIATKKAEALQEVYASKAFAARHLANWQLRRLKKKKPCIDTTVLFSSISADLGMYGQVDYSGANNMLDGIAARLTRAGLRTVAINWPAFEDVGMAARTETGNSGAVTTLAAELAENALFSDEGAQSIERVVAAGDLPRVVVSRKSFEPRRQTAIEDGRASVIQAIDANVSESQIDSPVERMLEIWRDTFGNDEIGPNEDYFQLGGDSLLAVGLISQIEQTFKQLVPISHLIASPTVEKLVTKLGLDPSSDSLANESSSGSSSKNAPSDVPDYFIHLREGDPDIAPLVLVHGADGAVMFYRQFAQALKTNRTIYAIESPFLKNPNHDVELSVEAVAAQYVKGLLAFQSRGPYLLAGYSFGGVAAYEMTVQLEKMGAQVEQLIIFDIPNPAKVEHTPALERLRDFWKKQEQGTSRISKTVKLTKRLTESVRDRAKVEIENRMAATKAESNADSMFWRHKKTRERHMSMEEEYIPQSITAPLRIVVALNNSSKYRYDEQMGWGEMADDLRTIEIPGTHLELFDAAKIEPIIDATNQFLER